MTWMDYHLHSEHSADSAEPIARMCRRAVEIGLDEVCFTEHYDTDPYDPGYGYYDDARYERRLAAAREKFAGRLVVRKGLEFDFQSRHSDRLAARLADWRFDFLLGSVHNVFGVIVSQAIRDRSFPPDEVYRAYFDEVRALIATGLPHCLGHFDYVRKVSHDLLAGYRYGDYDREVADIVARLVDAGVGLEVNSRYLDAGQPVVPGLDVLRAYFDAGGRIVTLGSDAHDVTGVGGGLGEACRLLREAGFTEVMAYEAGRATPRPLPEAGEALVTPGSRH